MDKTKYTINAERKKCREAADAFGELLGKWIWQYRMLGG